MPSPTTNEPIRRGESYLLDDFRKRAGIGRHAYRSAIRNGLNVIRLHGRVYVRGDDWLDYLEQQAAKKSPNPPA